MPNYGTGVIATPAAAAAAAYCTFHTLATRRARIYKIIVTNTQTITSQIGLYRMLRITNYKSSLELFIKNNNLAI